MAKRIKPHKEPPEPITADNYQHDEETRQWLIEQGYELQVMKPKYKQGDSVWYRPPMYISPDDIVFGGFTKKHWDDLTRPAKVVSEGVSGVFRGAVTYNYLIDLEDVGIVTVSEFELNKEQQTWEDLKKSTLRREPEENNGKKV